MSMTVTQMLSFWRGRFQKHRNAKAWSVVPLCVVDMSKIVELLSFDGAGTANP